MPELTLFEAMKEIEKTWGFQPYDYVGSSTIFERTSTKMKLKCKKCSFIMKRTLNEFIEMKDEKGYYCDKCCDNTPQVEDNVIIPKSKEDEKYSYIFGSPLFFEEAIIEKFGSNPYELHSMKEGEYFILTHKPCGLKFTARPSELFENREFTDFYDPSKKILMPFCPSCDKLFISKNRNIAGEKAVEQMLNIFSNAGFKDIPYLIPEDQVYRYKSADQKITVQCAMCGHIFISTMSELLDTKTNKCPKCKGNPPKYADEAVIKEVVEGSFEEKHEDSKILQDTKQEVVDNDTEIIEQEINDSTETEIAEKINQENNNISYDRNDNDIDSVSDDGYQGAGIEEYYEYEEYAVDSSQISESEKTEVSESISNTYEVQNMRFEENIYEKGETNMSQTTQTNQTTQKVVPNANVNNSQKPREATHTAGTTKPLTGTAPNARRSATNNIFNNQQQNLPDNWLTIDDIANKKGAVESFLMYDEFGRSLVELLKLYNIRESELIVNPIPAYGFYEITFGVGKILYIPANNRFITEFAANRSVINQQPLYGYGSTFSNPITAWAINVSMSEDGYRPLVVYGLDVQNGKGRATIDRVKKVCLPDRIKELPLEQLLSQQFQPVLLDTKVDKNLIELFNTFLRENEMYEIYKPYDGIAGLAINKYGAFMGFGMNPMMGGMPGMNPMMGGFGMNPMMGMGGFGMNPMMGGNPSMMGGQAFMQPGFDSPHQLLTALKYKVIEAENAPTIIDIVDYTDLVHLNIEHGLILTLQLFITNKINQLMNTGKTNLGVEFKLSLGHIAPNVYDELLELGFLNQAVLADEGIVFLTKTQKGNVIRISPDILKPENIGSIHKDLLEDKSFPKDLSTPEKVKKWEESLSKLGYVKCLSGQTHKIFLNPQFVAYAFYTIYMEKVQKQDVNQGVDNQTVDNTQQQRKKPIFGIGGLGMNPMMGGMPGMNPMMGMGGFGMSPMQPFAQGQQKQNNQQQVMGGMPGMNPMMGGFGMNPMMGMGGFGMNPMMGGMPGMNPMMGMGGFGMNPMMGGINIPIQQK